MAVVGGCDGVLFLIEIESVFTEEAACETAILLLGTDWANAELEPEAAGFCKAFFEGEEEEEEEEEEKEEETFAGNNSRFEVEEQEPMESVLALLLRRSVPEPDGDLFSDAAVAAAEVRAGQSLLIAGTICTDEDAAEGEEARVGEAFFEMPPL